jgi:hypothetical protein
MQTFLPYPDFVACAHVLDSRRLGKQRVEALQILRALLVPEYGWRHHPTVLMWKGYPEALGRYGLEVCREWRARGFADTCQPKILAHLALLGVELVPGQGQLAAAGLCQRGWATRPCTAATSRPCCARTRSSTARASRKSPTTCRTSGRSAPSRRSRPSGAVSPRPPAARSAPPAAPRKRHISGPSPAAARLARAGRPGGRPDRRAARSGVGNRWRQPWAAGGGRSSEARRPWPRVRSPRAMDGIGAGCCVRQRCRSWAWMVFATDTWVPSRGADQRGSSHRTSCWLGPIGGFCAATAGNACRASQ